jgi:hypothetical protein
MPRNRYLEAAGVVRTRWRRGRPTADSSPVLVEVWRSSLQAGEYIADFAPKVSVSAEIEIWVRRDNRWYLVDSAGGADQLANGQDVRSDVRRWAPLAIRRWTGTVTLDHWEKED